mmetsp:Transcript_21707/g.30433  ORF Transcript_21707/g.30433 Transcript_21707/m.30433 type:complete len:213 (+) Transcript_21707:847-1485(+)|eukprot:CAMPEP_0184872666 /NCGR_PEP_ID=MMETSP0580-20130426/41420_1 /TAXON_ID=1118495 /ORGANISM="Dactyliosolen fragilissimus" /LENGTH=212 /DNA_ID=CAMNT_0027375497 /DNA_START=1231 /DNA_END=1869 /DNA_ORIENTATION=-
MAKSFDEQLNALKEDVRRNNIQTDVLHEINTIREDVKQNKLNIALINEKVNNTINGGKSANMDDKEDRRNSFGVTFNTEPTSQNDTSKNLPSMLPSWHISSKDGNQTDTSLIDLNIPKPHHATLPPHPNMNNDLSNVPDILLKPPTYNKSSNRTSSTLPPHPKGNMERLLTPPDMRLSTKDFDSLQKIPDLNDIFRRLSTESIDFNQPEREE